MLLLNMSFFSKKTFKSEFKRAKKLKTLLGPPPLWHWGGGPPPRVTRDKVVLLDINYLPFTWRCRWLYCLLRVCKQINHWNMVCPKLYKETKLGCQNWQVLIQCSLLQCVSKIWTSLTWLNSLVMVLNHCLKKWCSLQNKGSSINNVTVLGGEGVKDFVTTV